MLLGWWIFLYAFIVFPHQYVVTERPALQRLLRPALPAGECPAAGGVGTSGLDQFGRMAAGSICIFARLAVVYSVSSQFAGPRRDENGTYYSGSLYDVPLIGTRGVDGCRRFLGAGMGSAKPRVQFGPRGGRKSFRSSPCWRLLSLPALGRLDAAARSDRPLRRVYSASSPCWSRCWCWEDLCSCGSTSRTRH